MDQKQRDQRINALHRDAQALLPKIESIIDELNSLGPHSTDGTCALDNLQQWFDQISRR